MMKMELQFFAHKKDVYKRQQSDRQKRGYT